MDRRTFLRDLCASASLLPLAACGAPSAVPPPAGRAAALSVLDFGARGDGATDDSAAFQRAVDAAGAADPWSLAGSARVVVPFRPAGYRVAGLRMRSYVELVGIGGHVRLTNTTDTDTILCDGTAVTGDGVVRRTRIANFHIQGNPRSGSGIVYVEHADNLIERVRIKSHGGDGVRARKKPGGAKSDGLVLDNVWIDDNRGCGLRFGTNSHYCQVRGASRLSNNDDANIRVTGVSFSMFGGVVAASLSGVSVLVERAHGGGFFGTEFEATPSQTRPGTLLRLGTRGGGRALGMVVDSCVMTASGSPAPVVLIDVANAENISVRGGLLDSNSAAGVVAVRVGRDSRRIVLDNVRIGGNAGAGGFRAIDDATGRLIVRPEG